MTQVAGEANVVNFNCSPVKDADLSALLVSAGKDDNTQAMPGEDLLKKLAQELAVSEKTSPPLREGLAAIFNNLLSEKMGDEKLKAKLDKYPQSGASFRLP